VKSRLPVGRLAVEFFVILIGVLLALAVDQWAERREHRGLADEVLQALGAELTANLEQLDRRIAYHEEIRPTLDSLMALAQSGARLRLLGENVLPQGMGFWLLRDTAWETALVTEAVRYFDLPVTTILSTTYSLQEGLRAREDAVSNGLLRPEVLGAPDHGGAAIFLAATFEDVLAGERELRSFVDAAIAAIRERLGEDVSLESPIRISLSGSAGWPTAVRHRPPPPSALRGGSPRSPGGV